MILYIGTSDWVLIGSTLCLAIVALLTPALSEFVKRELFKPILKINFRLAPPVCHKTTYNLDSQKPVYFFRFEVENIGKTLCRNVENSLENVWIFNSASQPIKVRDFTPINLKWSLNYTIIQQNINTGKRIYCNIGHLPTKEIQEINRRLINPVGYKGNDLRLELDLLINLNAQLNCLPPGIYILEVKTYSENCKTLYNYLQISWSGIWSDDIDVMFQELVITVVDKPV